MHLFSCLTGKLNKTTGKLYISPARAARSNLSSQASKRNAPQPQGAVGWLRKKGAPPSQQC